MRRSDFTTVFARDRKRCLKEHWDMAALAAAMAAVVEADEQPVPASYHDHALVADLAGLRGLHIGGRASNWLLVYQIAGDTVVFHRTGSHDDVFR
jgi:mRNA interferase YafQ